MSTFYGVGDRAEWSWGRHRPSRSRRVRPRPNPVRPGDRSSAQRGRWPHRSFDSRVFILSRGPDQVHHRPSTSAHEHSQRSFEQQLDAALPLDDPLRSGRIAPGDRCGATTEHPQLSQYPPIASEPTGATGRSPGPSLLTVRLRFDRQPFPRPDSANSGFSSSRGATAGTSIKPRPRIDGSTG